jgi:hypothetical protein
MKRQLVKSPVEAGWTHRWRQGLRRPRLHINLHPLCREHDRPLNKNRVVFALLSQICATQKQLTEAFDHTQLLPPVAPRYSADQISPIRTSDSYLVSTLVDVTNCDAHHTNLLS